MFRLVDDENCEMSGKNSDLYLCGRLYREQPGINWNGHMLGVYKVESQHVLSIKSKSNVCIKSPGRVKT
jgi:hypothetical protein